MRRRGEVETERGAGGEKQSKGGTSKYGSYQRMGRFLVDFALASHFVTGSYDQIYMRHRGVNEGERWKGN